MENRAYLGSEALIVIPGAGRPLAMPDECHTVFLLKEPDSGGQGLAAGIITSRNCSQESFQGINFPWVEEAGWARQPEEEAEAGRRLGGPHSPQEGGGGHGAF